MPGISSWTIPAIEAGFNKILFIIRRDIETDFKEVIGNRIGAVCAAHGVEVGYAFQAREDLPAGFPVPEGRTKPWGTGQAVLSAKDLIHEPFAVLNADDYYGKEAFVKIHDFLVSSAGENQFCMAGFQLKNTLSDFGGVTYQEDKLLVIRKFQVLIQGGVYQPDLYSDL